jgi:dTDP-4-dehydrorhamnose reductase
MRRSVFVLGHRGMLGATVQRRLEEQGFDVLTTDLRYSGGPSDEVLATVADSRAEAAVNCIGITTARLVNDAALMLTNALLPLHLAAVMGDRLVVHPSTDCVFRGDRGEYEVGDRPDAIDPYGLSKRLGEASLTRDNVVVLRTSIVGPEVDSARGLLAWFLRQSASANGWVDHRWNGITTLAWADLCRAAIDRDPRVPPGLHQPTTEAFVSKYELLRLFADVFHHAVEIIPVTTGAPKDRTLKPTLVMPPIRSQLEDLRDWTDSLVGGAQGGR